MKDVYLNDTNMNYDQAQEYFSDANKWALNHCPSYAGYNVQDVADFSYINDLIALYQFKDEKDQMWFELKWKT